jgi:hypothetical protein
MEAFYRDFLDRNGVRPTATEAFHAGLDPKAGSERSWLGFVEWMGGLDPAERAAWTEAKPFLLAIERTAMTRSYKVALLLAMFDGEAFVPSLDVDAIVPRVAALARKTRRLAEDFSVDLDDAAALRRLLIENPIAAFVPRDLPAGGGHFTFDGRRFGLSVPVADATGFGRLLREILDWRLAQYLSRSGDGRLAADVICRVAGNGSGSPILFLPPAGAGGALPPGPLAIVVEGRAMEAVVAKVAINVVRAPDETVNRLPGILRSWFGEEAGVAGRGHAVRLRRDGETVVMEPVGRA